MAELTRDQIIAQLRDLQDDPRTIGYDTFMQGFKLLNPRFAEFDQIVKDSGGAWVNSLQDQLETAFNENPQFMDAMIAISDDPDKMDQMIGLLNTNQGQDVVVRILAAGNGEASFIDQEQGITTPTIEQFNKVSDIGFANIAADGGVEIRENPVKTVGDSLRLLAVLAAPVALAETPALLASTALRSAFTGAARWAGGVIARNPLTSFTVADWGLNDGRATEYAIGKAVDTVGGAVLGEETYNGVKNTFNGNAEDGWSLANLALPAALTAVGGFLAYNMLSQNIGTVLTLAVATVGAVLAYNYLTDPSNARGPSATADTTPDQRRDVAPPAPVVPAV